MYMDKHIVSLLQEKNRVIIPELGAFIVKQSTPKTFVFNEFLKYNDGLLVEHVMKQENISKEEATRKIDDYVIDVNSKLNIGEPHTIENLGTLRKDRGGKVQFQPDEPVQQPPNYESPQEEKTGPEPEVPKEKTKEKEETPIELIDEPEKKVEKKTEEEDVASKKKETPPPVPPPVQHKDEKPKKEIPVTKAGKHEDNKAEKPQPTGKATTSIYNDKNARYQPTGRPKKGNPKTGWWIALMAVVVIAIGIWVFLNRDFIFGDGQIAEQETVMGKDVKEEAPAELEKADETAGSEDQSQEEEEIPVETSEPEMTGSPEKQQQAETTAQQDIKKYYIVAGCFREEQNANEYAEYLREQGYNAEKFGKYTGLHAVSFDAFGNYNKALEELSKIRNKVEPEAWILYY